MSIGELKSLDRWSLPDLEAVRLLLSGDSVIDWHRLNFSTLEEVHELLKVHEFDLGDEADRAVLERVKAEAVDYLRRHFEFPVPRQVERLPVDALMLLASTRGHKQLCACTILKCMHIIQHLEGRELLFVLPLSDQEVFHMVEEKVYRVVGGMLAAGMPITEFIGGRKNKYSLYTKLLSKERNAAAQIYDKLRFRLVTRGREDILPVIHYLTQRLFPFNYAIPRESTNTIFPLSAFFMEHPHLRTLINDERINGEDTDTYTPSGNTFSDEEFRIIHFVVDLPLRVPKNILAQAPASAQTLGPVIFSLAEFQIVDRETEAANELGDASHERYKERQRQAVMRRLKLGARAERPISSAAGFDSEPLLAVALPAFAASLAPPDLHVDPAREPPRETPARDEPPPGKAR